MASDDGEPWLPILGDTSPLRRLPAALAPVLRTWLEAFRYSAEIADLSFRRLTETLDHATAVVSGSAGEQSPIFVASFADAWMFVDSVWRMRELLLRPPPGTERRRSPDRPSGIRRSEFTAKLSGLKEMRDGVQHLDTTAPKLAQTGEPVWGSLSWIAVNDEGSLARGCVMVAGTLVNERAHRIPNPLGKQVNLPIDHIRLAAHGKEISLSDIHAQLARTVHDMEESLRGQFAGLDTGPADAIFAIDVAIEARDEDVER